MLRSLIRIALATALLPAAVFAVAGGGWYRAIDSARMSMRHVNRVLHYELGYQLPGTPDLARLDERLQARGLKRGDPVFIRVFKSEMTLELWMKQGDGFALFASYPICYWSGRLGPKLQTGDRQAPEGFYTVSRGQLNPNSHWHRAFDLGFPNLFDRAQGRSGAYLMVHGGCSSVGCYAMTNAVVGEMWTLVTAALDAGQQRFHVQIFPFRLTDARLRAYEGNQWAGFWRELKPGYDLFEASHIPPEVNICRGKYTVRPGRAGSSAAPPMRIECPPAEQPRQS
jgi:murein L,D-transpeptidase YafK